MAEEFENLELRDENTGEVETFTPVDVTAREQIESLNETLTESGIGGRNYLLNTKDLTDDGSLRVIIPSIGSREIDKDGYGIITLNSLSGTYYRLSIATNINNVIEEPLEGQKMVLSFDAKADTWKDSFNRFSCQLSICRVNDSGNNLNRLYYYILPISNSNFADTSMDKWTRVRFPFTVPSVSSMNTDASYSGQEVLYVFQIWTDATSGNTLMLRKPKLELGNIPTDWTPAPEDFWYDLDQLKG